MLLRMERNATESTLDTTHLNVTNDPNPFSDFKNIIIATVLLIIIIGKSRQAFSVEILTDEIIYLI